MKYSELIEKKRHGTPYFPVEHYYIDRDHPRYIMAAHWHKECEIIKVVSGRLTIYLNSTKYELFAGDCLFVEGGCLKRGYPDNCVYECLVFDTAMLARKVGEGKGKSFFENDGSELEYKNFIDRNDTEIHVTVDNLLRAVREAKPFFELEMISLLYKLFYELYSSGYIVKNKNLAVDKGVRTVMSLLKWIESHNSEQITLAKISEVSGLSEKYLCRIFKEYTSKTIMDYVNESRIEKACVAMQTQSITEAAFSCGFNDLSYFCKTFKKYKGLTPSEYKKAYIK